ncbi:Bidirectional sugar transporter SWEET [Heracleum sosnowskyi]|uniref:Bidirectional sugar transporter SWEET n=1 Tax=Heracleum sosnowskyi TaxID=360622 RepID=A0AAD8MK00_9APIA|nr:Bidirectional sugar transporter SWEET [Heracleum sosnowskyi]
MASNGLFSTYSLCSDAAGVAGNIFAIVLFMSPIPTFRRIIRNRSTEQFSGLPYIISLLSCLIHLWYGLPVVTPGVILVATVSSIGALFHSVYIVIFITCAEKAPKVKMLGLLLGVFALFSVVVLVSIKLFESPSRQLFVGYLGIATLISTFGSPLLISNLVIKTKSVEYMPFYLSLSTFLTCLFFFAYGMFKHDPFIAVPNGVGTFLGIVQLALYAYYSRFPAQESTEPLLVSYA